MAERYAAFISYSHKDRRVAAWLHRLLEGYRVPPALIGQPGAHGPVPARIAPVFRDRDDLSVSADLAATVRDVLARSDALIVICSPDAARSRWVNEEVVEFKRRHGDARVFALVIAGEPFASTMPGGEAEECFPPALRTRTDGQGPTLEATVEPMAADMRPGGDGRRIAILKLIAGLLGLPLDALIHREHVRRQRHLTAVAAASIAAVLAMGALTWQAFSARNEAQSQRADAEQLVEFMLTDLRGKLEEVGRLDVMDAVGNEALGYYGRQTPNSLDAKSLGRQARALHLIGEVKMFGGSFAAAQRAFQAAAATTAELLARAPNDGDRVFDHAQSVFWLGYLAYEHRRFDAARPAFEEYARLADRLVLLDPGRPEWRAELGYSRINLGTLRLQDRQPASAARAFAEAVREFQTLARTEATNASWPIWLAQANGWLADAERARGNLKRAIDARLREHTLYKKHIAGAGSDAQARAAYSWSETALGELALDHGNIGAASSRLKSAVGGFAQLLAADSNNQRWSQLAISTKQVLAEALLASGDVSAADRVLAEARQQAAELVTQDPTMLAWSALPARLNVLRAELAFKKGDPASAREFALMSAETFSQMRRHNEGGPIDRVYWPARAAIALALAARSPAEATPHWQRAEQMLTEPKHIDLAERCLLLQVYQARGYGTAASLRSQLAAAGYRHPSCSYDSVNSVETALAQ